MTGQAHLDEGDLQALLDGEMDAAMQEEARRHLEACDECSRVFSEVEEMAHGATVALEALDVEAPSLTAAQIRDAAAGWKDTATQSPAEPAERDRDRGTRSRFFLPQQPWLKAAALAAVTLGVTAAALPGSPVRGWIGSGWRWISGAALSEATTVEPASEAGATAVETLAEAGIRVNPVDGEVRIVLTEILPGTEIDVLLVDGEQAGVFAGTGTRFSSRAGVLEVSNPDGGVRIELPESVRLATVEVNGEIYLRKDAEGLELLGPTQVSTTSQLRFRVPEPVHPPRP